MVLAIPDPPFIPLDLVLNFLKVSNLALIFLEIANFASEIHKISLYREVNGILPDWEAVFGSVILNLYFSNVALMQLLPPLQYYGLGHV